MVMERLAQVNEVAYVRFASVYRRFKDIAGFEKELSHIKERKNIGPVEA
jgi:transcriptional repressor NrdR